MSKFSGRNRRDNEEYEDDDYGYYKNKKQRSEAYEYRRMKKREQYENSYDDREDEYYDYRGRKLY